MTTCPVCSGTLPPQRGPRARRYCSRACQAKAYRARQRQHQEHRISPGEEQELLEAYAEVPATELADSLAAAARRLAGALNAGLPADGFDLGVVARIPLVLAARAHQAAPAAHASHGIPARQAAPTVTVRRLAAPPSEQHGAPEPLSSRDASPLPADSAAAHPHTEASRDDPVSAPTEKGAHRDAAAPRPRRRTQSSRDGSRPSAAPEKTQEGIHPRPQGLSQRAARQIADSAELVRNPDYRDTHRATVRSGATVLGYVEPSYGGTSASGRNGWIGSVAPGHRGPVRKTQQQATVDVALSWIRIVTAKPRPASD